MEHCCVLTSLEGMKDAGSDGFHIVIPAQGETWMLLQHRTHPARHGEVLPAVWEVGAQAPVSLERRSTGCDPPTGPRWATSAGWPKLEWTGLQVRLPADLDKVRCTTSYKHIPKPMQG